MRVLLLLLGLTGCAGSAERVEGARCFALWEAEASVEIGTGAAEFVALQDDEAVDVVQTPQGLLAVYGSLRADGVLGGHPDDLTHPSNPRVTFEVTDGDHWLGGYRNLPRPLQTTGATTGELWGDVLALDPETAYEALGRPAWLRVEVVDACGTVVQDARRVTLQQAF